MSATAHDLPTEFLAELGGALQKDRGQLLLDPADCWTYGYDYSRRQSLPGAVALPETTEQVAAIVAACYRHHISICPRGRGTATTGAAVPRDGGIALSLERMNRIVAVDPDNRIAVTQSGVINADLQDALSSRGFFWPPDPTSAAYSTVGGNLACNAAGPRTLKYGTPRDNTLGLVAVTGTGKIIRTGSQTTKSVVGYDLTRLLVGSEGSLAIITEAILLLTPMPAAQSTLRACYRSAADAAAAVSAIMAQPARPRSIEFMDQGALEAIAGTCRFSTDTRALLLIDIDGSDSELAETTRAIRKAAGNEGLLEWRAAETSEDAQTLWNARKALSPSLRKLAAGKINEDVVVPVSKIPDLVSTLSELEKRHSLRIVSFGHAGNGNLHVNLLFDPDDKHQAHAAEECLAEVFAETLKLGGSLSGEHGIGLIKRDFVGLEIGTVELELMRSIKLLFDPHQILNPGKIFPDQP